MLANASPKAAVQSEPQSHYYPVLHFRKLITVLNRQKGVQVAPLRIRKVLRKDTSCIK